MKESNERNVIVMKESSHAIVMKENSHAKFKWPNQNWLAN